MGAIKTVLKMMPLYSTVKSIRTARNEEERYVRKLFGKKNGNSLYIIRRYRSAGFFSNFFFVLGHIIYASDNGWDFLVDMENYPTLYNEKKAVDGTNNAWEYYFEQPLGISLKDKRKYKNIILSSSNYQFDKVPSYGGNINTFPDKKFVERLIPYCNQYIKILPEITGQVKEIRNLWGNSVLGIHIRGTDMKTNPTHPDPPEISQYIVAIDKLMEDNVIDNIFLCTDEQKILNEMTEKYGNLVVCTNAFRSNDGESIHGGTRCVQRENHRYLTGREVLVDVLALSMCDFLICGHSNVSYAAIVLNQNKYKSITLLENEKQCENCKAV